VELVRASVLAGDRQLSLEYLGEVVAEAFAGSARVSVYIYQDW
jgi:hypothetical protein